MSRASLLMIGVGLLLLGSLSGCLPGYLRMDISAPQGLNDSTPMHFLVREVDAQQYRTESYDSVSMLAVQRNDSVLRSKVLYAKNKSISERLFLTARASSWTPTASNREVKATSPRRKP